MPIPRSRCAGYQIVLLQGSLPPCEAGDLRGYGDLPLLQPIVPLLHRQSTLVDAVIFAVAVKPAVSNGKYHQSVCSAHDRCCIRRRRLLCTKLLRFTQSGHLAILRGACKRIVTPSGPLVCRIDCHPQSSCKSVLSKGIALSIT